MIRSSVARWAPSAMARPPRRPLTITLRPRASQLTARPSPVVRRALTTSNKTPVPSQPPLWCRAAVVGSATGLGTPIFATAGVVVIWYRYISTLSGPTQLLVFSVVGGGVYTLISHYVGPFLLNHSEFVVPFAAANTIASAFWYTALDLTIGLKVMQGQLSPQLAKQYPVPAQLARMAVPLGGPAIGFLTAATAGFLWAPLTELLWPSDVQEAFGELGRMSWLVDLHMQLFPYVGAPVGLVAGYGMHGLLAPVVTGNLTGSLAGKPWTSTALPLLGLFSGASALYFAFCGVWDSGQLFWEKRIDTATGEEISYNLKTGACVPGSETKKINEAGRFVLGTARFVKQPWKVLLPSVFGEADSISFDHFADDDSKVKLIHLLDHQSLHYLIDLMVRLKGFDLGRHGSKDASGTELDVASLLDAKQKVLDQARTELGIKLDDLLHHAELCLIAERKVRQEQQENKPKRSVRDYISLRTKIWSLDPKTGEMTGTSEFCGEVEGMRALRLLSQNLPVLRRRLKAELNFEPDDTHSLTKHLVRARFEKNVDDLVQLAWNGLTTTATWTALAGVPLIIIRLILNS